MTEPQTSVSIRTADPASKPIPIVALASMVSPLAEAPLTEKSKLHHIFQDPFFTLLVICLMNSFVKQENKIYASKSISDQN